MQAFGEIGVVRAPGSEGGAVRVVRSDGGAERDCEDEAALG